MRMHVKTQLRVLGEIQRRAESEVRLDELIKQWPASTDADEHIAAIRNLFDSGVSIVNIHSGQADQLKFIEFYSSEVLPVFRQLASYRKLFFVMAGLIRQSLAARVRATLCDDVRTRR